MVSCETPQGGSSTDLTKALSSPTRNGSNYANALDSHMRGPTYGARAGCPAGTFDPNTRTMNFSLQYSQNPNGSIKGEPQVMWDECNSDIRSNYVTHKGPTSCNQWQISKEFVSFFDKNFDACAQKAYGALVGRDQVKPDRLGIGHVGIAGDSSHTNRSYHSVNRAIDISYVDFTIDGEKKRFDVSKQGSGQEKKFFDSFRACWDSAIRSHRSNCPGRTPKGSIGHEDHNHKHHLHLSLPYCPPRGYYSK